MHVLSVNASLDARSGGGTAERTFQMSRFLARSGVTCTVLSIDTGLPEGRVEALAPARAVLLPQLWKRFHVPMPCWKRIRELVAEADVVHIMGHWEMLNALAYLAARRLGKPYVICPAGALPIFGRSRWLKLAYNALVGGSMVRCASAWIAVTAGEFPSFADYGIPSQQVTVLPNGVCADDFGETDLPEISCGLLAADKPYILFMGRLNAIKGPDLLLDAFAKVSGRFPGYQLVFAGPDEGLLESLKISALNQGIGDRVHFAGRVQGRVKTALYRRARLLVVPSRQEAMSVVVLEAGICGTPVLVTDRCGFPEIRSVDERLEVPATADGLAGGLNAILACDDAMKIGPKMKAFVEARYSWHTLINRYSDLFNDAQRSRVHPCESS